MPSDEVLDSTYFRHLLFIVYGLVRLLYMRPSLSWVISILKTALLHSDYRSLSQYALFVVRPINGLLYRDVSIGGWPNGKQQLRSLLGGPVEAEVPQAV